MKATTRNTRNFVFSATALTVFLGALDTYVIISVLFKINDDLGIPINQFQRIMPAVTGYLLGYIVAMPLLGQGSDRFGRKKLLQLAQLVFLAGSILTAIADHLDVLVTGRTLQGAAAGALLPVTLALISDLWQGESRTMMLGFAGGAQELGALVGPLYGLIIYKIFDQWQAIFWLNVPLIIITMSLIHVGLPAEKTHKTGKVDYIGAILLGITLTFVVLGFNNKDVDKRALPENAGLYLGIAAVALIVFIAWEYYTPVKIIDFSSTELKPFVASLIVSFCVGTAMMVTLVDIEVYVRLLHGFEEDRATKFLSRFLIAVPFGAILGGITGARWGIRGTIIAGLLTSAFGFYRVAQWGTSVMSDTYPCVFVHLPVTWVDLIIVGIGIGLVIGPLATAAVNAVTPAYHGMSSALLIVCRMLGMLIGLAALASWGLHMYWHKLKVMNEQVLAQTGLTAQQQQIAMAHNIPIAYQTEYHQIFLLTAGICIVGALVSLLVKNSSSIRHSSDNEVGKMVSSS